MVFISNGSLLVIPSESETYLKDNFLLVSTRKAGGCFFNFDFIVLIFILFACVAGKERIGNPSLSLMMNHLYWMYSRNDWASNRTEKRKKINNQSLQFYFKNLIFKSLNFGNLTHHEQRQV
jgi:hypothetical protein